MLYPGQYVRFDKNVLEVLEVEEEQGTSQKGAITIKAKDSSGKHHLIGILKSQIKNKVYAYNQ